MHALNQIRRGLMPSALIIGITGFTGSVLARRLFRAGWTVRGIDENEDAAPDLDELGIDIELADVGDPDDLEGIGRTGDHVFYVMRSVSDTRADMERRTIRGVTNVVDALGSTEIASFVYGSTLAVYGPGSLDTLTELSPVNSDTELGELNVETEDFLRSQYDSRKFPTRVIRAGTVYGPGGGTLESLERRGLRLVGGGHNPTSRIHVDDAATIFQAVAESGRSGEVYLAVDDNPAPAAVYLGHLAAEAGLPPPRSSPKILAQAMVQLSGGVARLTRSKSPISASLLGLVASPYPTSNAKVRKELGVKLRYPTYVEGTATLLESTGDDA